jgi:DNA invertase Pin-like site-specific DNA recombinase
LQAAGCEQLYTDTASGAPTDRPGLSQALSHLRSGDTLVVWRLDRLGRNLPHLIETVSGLAERGVGFRSLQEQLDTTTSGGKLVFHVFGALAELERDLIRERTHAGLAAARTRGQLFGRPKVLSPQQVRQLQTLGMDHRNTVAEICQTLGISWATFYRYVHEAQPGRRSSVCVRRSGGRVRQHVRGGSPTALCARPASGDSAGLPRRSRRSAATPHRIRGG